MLSLIRRFTLITVTALLSHTALADAGNGEFMGYTLGNDYQAGAATERRMTANGNAVIKAENPVKPANIAKVSVVTTPESLTIGFIDASQWFATEQEARDFGRKYYEILRAKYYDWEMGQERLNNNLQVTELSLVKPPYNLRLQLAEDEDETNETGQWRFSMTLSWLSDSKEYRAWNNMARTQRVAEKEEQRKQLLEDADLRGL